MFRLGIMSLASAAVWGWRWPCAKHCTARKDCGRICFAFVFCVCGQQKPEDSNLSPMVDDAITWGGIQGLESSLYICVYNTSSSPVNQCSCENWVCLKFPWRRNSLTVIISYAGFRLTCRLPHCRFDDDISSTAQASLAAEGWPSGKQRQANRLITLPLCPPRQIADSWILFNSGAIAARWKSQSGVAAESCNSETASDDHAA